MDSSQLFNKFTARARRALSLARQEAQRFGHKYQGTEHVLLGIVHEGGGIAARVLRDLGVALHAVGRAVETRGVRSTTPYEYGLPLFAPGAREALWQAWNEARYLHHDFIGTEHVLLGLLDVGETGAAKVLQELGLSLDQVREDLLGAMELDAPPRGGGKLDGDRGGLGREELRSVLARALPSLICEVPLKADRLSPGVVSTLRDAARTARETAGRPAGLEHLLIETCGPQVDLPRGPGALWLHRSALTRALRAIRRRDCEFNTGSWPTPYGADLAEALDRAWALAERGGAPRLEMLHLFVALLQSEHGRWSEMLGACGADVERLRRDAEESLARLKPSLAATPPPASQEPLRLSEDAWQVLRTAWQHARRLGHARVGLPHLLVMLLEGHPRHGDARAALASMPDCSRTDELRFDSIAASAIERARDLAIEADRHEVLREALILGCLWADRAQQRRLLPCSDEEASAWRAWLYEGGAQLAQPTETFAARPAAFSKKVLDRMSVAQLLAGSDSHGCIEPRHVWMVVNARASGSDRRLGMRLGIDATWTGDRPMGPAESVVEVGDRGDHPVFTSEAIALISLAAEESYALRASEIDEDHLFLALIRMGEPLALRALSAVGLTLLAARIAALELVLARDDAGP